MEWIFPPGAISAELLDPGDPLPPNRPEKERRFYRTFQRYELFGNKKLVVTSASLLVTSAVLVVTRS